MVTIINFKERNKEDGTSFFVLEAQGGIEMVKSQTTGQFYATAKKAYIPSTFDELTCKALIGTQMPGAIEKVKCDSYEFTVQETGEIISLSHRYQYVPEDSTPVPQKESTIQQRNSSYSQRETAENHTFSLNEEVPV